MVSRTILSSADSVIVIAASHTGNNMMCTPAIRLLKKFHPQIRLAVVALNKISAEVFAQNNDIDHLYVTKSASKVYRMAKDYNLAICLNPKSSYLLSRLQIPKYQIPDFEASRHHADQILEFMSELIICEVEPEDRKYHINA